MEMTFKSKDIGFNQKRDNKFQFKKIDRKRFTKILLVEKDLI